MIEYCVQRRFTKNGKWFAADEQTFAKKTDAMRYLECLEEQDKFSAFLPEELRVDYAEFRVASRKVTTWKGAK